MNALSGYALSNTPAGLSDQTQVSQWNGQGFITDRWSTNIGLWNPSGDVLLLPGKAALVTNTPAVLPFAGIVAQGIFTNPIVVGSNYVSSLLPLAGRLHSDLKYNPNDGDTVYMWNGGATPTSSKYYVSTNGWNPSEPFLAVGQGILLTSSSNNLWIQTNLLCSGAFSSLLSQVGGTNLGTGIDASPALSSNNILYIPDTNNLLFCSQHVKPQRPVDSTAVLPTPT